MPLLEVTQTRHLSASIRLTDTTASQVDQYASFIRASADDVVEQAVAYVFSKDRDFQEFLKSPEAQRIRRHFVFVAAMEMMLPSRGKSPLARHHRQHKRLHLRRDRRHDPAPTSVA